MLITAVQQTIAELAWKTHVDVEEKNFELVKALGYVEDAHTVVGEFADGSRRKVTAKFIVIAVESRPIFPNIPGAEEFRISTDSLGCPD